MGTEITLESLGFTQEDLQERVIESLCDRVLRSSSCDEDGEPTHFESTLASKLRDKIEKKLQDISQKFVDEKVGPKVIEYINQMLLTQSDRWGTPKAPPKTFAEYVTDHVDSYLKQKVDRNGARYGDGDTERGAWLVWNTIRESVNEIVKGSVSKALETIKGGIEGQIKESLSKMFAQVDVKVAQNR